MLDERNAEVREVVYEFMPMRAMYYGIVIAREALTVEDEEESKIFEEVTDAYASICANFARRLLRLYPGRTSLDWARATINGKMVAEATGVEFARALYELSDYAHALVTLAERTEN